MSTNRWADKQHRVALHNRMLLCHRQGGRMDTCYNMDGPENVMPRGRSQTCKATAVCCHLHHVSPSRGTESRFVVASSWRDRGCSGVADGHEVAFWGVDVLELDPSEGCTTLWMHLMPTNCTLENGEDGAPAWLSQLSSCLRLRS